ncbi:MAG: hypothetical protein IJN76_04775, partial [Clostridia bacterium]|nr:hypothetical protein [Clostridia bacterium]
RGKHRSYTTYTCANCGDSYVDDYTEALGHTAGAAADCENDQVCTGCGAVLNAALGHDYKGVVTAPDCENGGYTTYTCANCGDSYVDDYTEALGHTYDNEYDADCNVCGEIREVEMPIYFGGNSISEDVSGLAFRFDVDAIGMTVDKTTAIYDAATVDGNKLVSMGAVASNNGSVPSLETADGDNVVNIPAVYLCYLTEDTASFAVRITGIPGEHYDTIVNARPYIIVELDGVETVIYGTAQSASYHSVNG